VVFSKPTSAVLQDGETIVLPAHSSDVHFETELVLLIGQGGRQIRAQDALGHISAYAVGLDLTARDVQTRAKQNGLPWETGKGFDGSACLSAFLPFDPAMPLQAFEFGLGINGQQRQHGRVSNMLYSAPEIIAYLSSIFTLQAGDIVYTGTPEGVGPLAPGDALELTLNGSVAARFTVA
jgi:2-keto-4-pentenoate hydratase/2-oxohepta-3-ene-1,7-dioic acid hydratase in catechol pathway